MRRDAIECFQWRIRNLPYPSDTYLLEVEPTKQEIIIKTTNKKYYKKFDVPDLKRMNIKLNKDNLSHSHKNETLIVSVPVPLPSIRSPRRSSAGSSRCASSSRR